MAIEGVIQMEHAVFLHGYKCSPAAIPLGTFDSYGKEYITVSPGPEWDGTAIKMVFNPPNKKPVEIRVGSDNRVEVPPEALAEVAGSGAIVFVGYKDGMRIISTNLQYFVAGHDNIDGLEPGEPTPDLTQQIMVAANNAEKTANSVREDADAGKFDGPMGPPGPPGDGSYNVLTNLDVQELLNMI